jgi:hypothetical protein
MLIFEDEVTLTYEQLREVAMANKASAERVLSSHDNREAPRP